MLVYYEFIINYYLDLKNLKINKDKWFFLGIAFAAFLGGILGLVTSWYYITLVIIDKNGVIQ